MFNIGPLELVAILVIALLVVGPEELPKVAKKIGAFIGELRRQGEEVRSQVREMIDDAVSDDEMKATVESIEKVRGSLSLGPPDADKVGGSTKTSPGTEATDSEVEPPAEGGRSKPGAS